MFANVIVLGSKQGAATGESGRFRLTGMTPGAHSIKVRATGYDPIVVADTLRLGVNPPLEMKLGRVCRHAERLQWFAGRA